MTHPWLSGLWNVRASVDVTNSRRTRITSDGVKHVILTSCVSDCQAGNGMTALERSSGHKSVGSGHVLASTSNAQLMEIGGNSKRTHEPGAAASIANCNACNGSRGSRVTLCIVSMLPDAVVEVAVTR